MAITVNPIKLLPLKIMSVSPSIITVTTDEPESVLDEEAELEKLVASSDADHDEKQLSLGVYVKL